MIDRLTRRRFLAGAVAGTAVVAFDTVGRSWVTAASASERMPSGAALVPGLDGELVTDPAALGEAADDFGHIVHRMPIAVLRPTGTASTWRCAVGGTPRSGRRRWRSGW